MSDLLLCTEEGIGQVQEALRAEDLDGWLLYEFRGANPISKAMLGVGKTTRRGFFLIPAEGEPVALIHAIEGSSWRHWPWARRTYSGWREMEAELDALLEGRGRLAAEISPGAAVPTLDYLPGGLTEVLLRTGIELASSGNLISRFHSVWSEEQLQDHRDAAVVLAEVARRAFERAAEAIRSGNPTTEGALSDWIRSEVSGAGFPDNMDCIVAVGRTASDPHYGPVGEGETITAGELLLIDLWGGRPGSVPADQTWMGMMASAVDERTQEIWEAVRDARDAAVAFLRERFEAGEEVRGFEVDDVSRGVIAHRGFGEYFVHRTGHSIDTTLHGSGPNLDNLETRDDRLIIPGVGFSVEPGIYIPGDIGVRSEINVYWSDEGPLVTPPEVQREIFLLLGE
ncbi:MAG: M24 family metallopeptidase [Gemmatimonadota bacterium]